MGLHEFELIDRVACAWTDRILLFAGAAEPRAFSCMGIHRPERPYEGTQNMSVNEAYETAVGSMIMQPYDLYKTQLKAGDIVLIGAISPDNGDEIQVARYAKQLGALVVAFGPFDGNGGAGSLRDHVDVAINTHSGDGAGVLDIPGFDEPVCPIGGLSGNLVLWLLTAQWKYDDRAQASFLKRGY